MSVHCIEKGTHLVRKDDLLHYCLARLSVWSDFRPCILFLYEWMSKWLLFNANSAFFLAISLGDQAIILNEMMMRSTLYWICIVLAPRKDMSPHSHTLSWFRANRSLLFLLNAASVAEKQHISILYYLVWPDRGPNQRFTTLWARRAR